MRRGFKVRRGFRLWRGSECGVALRVRRGSGVAWLRGGVARRVRRGSVCSASACCKAGPSSTSHGGSSLAERRSDEDTRRQASTSGEV